MANHIENLLDREPDLPEADRRRLKAQLVALREPIGTPEADRRMLGAFRALQTMAPRAYELALPIIRTVATSEILHQLHIPPG
jgi:hypothetical protein